MRENLTRKGLAAIYRQEIIRDVTLFTSPSAAVFYDKLFTALNFTLPRAATGRRGFPKEAMVCAFIVMKCEGFSQITDLADYLDNNRLIARYCGFDIMRPLPSYWTYDRFSADAVLPLRECTFLGDKGYDVKAVYDLIKDVCQGDAVIPLNKHNTNKPGKTPCR